jgi:hypothetical protein
VPPSMESSCWAAAYALAIGCSLWGPGASGHTLQGLFIGRQGHAFFIDTPVNTVAGPGIPKLQVRALGGGVLADGPRCDSIDLLTDAAGADAPACGGGRYTFDGVGFASAWTASASPSRTVPALNLFLAADGTGYSLTAGTAIPGFNGAGQPLLVATSSSPVLYSYTAAHASLTAQRISSNGYVPSAVPLPGVPGPVIDDSLLDPRTGTLYVASNGQVSAIAVEPADLAGGGTAWATRSRDNCRSNNLEFACPF